MSHAWLKRFIEVKISPLLKNSHPRIIACSKASSLVTSIISISIIRLSLEIFWSSVIATPPYIGISLSWKFGLDAI